MLDIGWLAWTWGLTGWKEELVTEEKLLTVNHLLFVLACVDLCTQSRDHALILDVHLEVLLHRLNEVFVKSPGAAIQFCAVFALTNTFLGRMLAKLRKW